MTSMDKGNVALKSKLWRQGVVSGVSMLQRAEMLKPPRNSRYGAEGRFTKVQEMKQDRVSLLLGRVGFLLCL